MPEQKNYCAMSATDFGYAQCFRPRQTRREKITLFHGSPKPACLAELIRWSIGDALATACTATGRKCNVHQGGLASAAFICQVALLEAGASRRLKARFAGVAQPATAGIAAQDAFLVMKTGQVPTQSLSSRVLKNDFGFFTLQEICSFTSHDRQSCIKLGQKDWLDHRWPSFFNALPSFSSTPSGSLFLLFTQERPAVFFDELIYSDQFFQTT